MHATQNHDKPIQSHAWSATLIYSVQFKDSTDVTLAWKDGQTSGTHQVILLITSAMAHTIYGELRQLFETFTRVWGAGGQTSLHLHTQDGQARATLDIQLGPPADPALELQLELQLTPPWSYSGSPDGVDLLPKLEMLLASLPC